MSSTRTAESTEHNTELNDWFCTKCGRDQGTREAARRHSDSCTQYCIWGCKACGQDFHDYATAVAHVNAHWDRARQNQGNVLRLLDPNIMHHNRNGR